MKKKLKAVGAKKAGGSGCGGAGKLSGLVADGIHFRDCFEEWTELPSCSISSQTHTCLDLLKMIDYFPNRNSNTWGIYRESWKLRKT